MDNVEPLVTGDDATVSAPRDEPVAPDVKPTDARQLETPAAAAPALCADPRTADVLSFKPLPAPPHAPRSRDAVAHLVDEAVERITAAMQARARSDRFHQDLITRLHSDLQEQVNRSAVLPVVTGMLRLQEEMEKVAEHLRAEPGALTVERMLQQFSEFADDIGLLLEQAGVVRFRDEAMGDQFNGSRQTMLGRDMTRDAALNRRISMRVRAGTDFGKTLLRREGVRVYAFEPSAAAAPLETSKPVQSESQTEPRRAAGDE